MMATKALALAPLLLGVQCSFLGQRPNPVGWSSHTSSNIGWALRDLVKEEQAARAELAAQRDDALAALASAAENKTELGRTKLEVAHLRRELNAKKARLSATAEELEHAKSTDNAAKNEVTHLRRQILHLQHKDNSTNKEVAQLHRELRNLKQKDNSTEHEAATLRQQLQELNHKLAQRDEEVQKLKKTASTLKPATNTHKEMRKVTDQAMNLNKQIINALKGSHEEAERKDRELMQAKAKLQKEEADFNTVHKQLDAKIKLVAQLRKELNKDKVGSQQSHDQLVKTFKDLRTKLTSKDKTLHSSQAALKMAVTQLKALRERLSTQDHRFHDLLGKMTAQEQALLKDKVMLAASKKDEEKEKAEHNKLMQEIRVMQKEVQQAKAETESKDGDLKRAHMKLDRVVEEMAKAKLAAKANEQALVTSQESLKVKADKLKAEGELLTAQRSELVNATARLTIDEEEIRRSRGEMQGEEKNLDNFIKEHKNLFEDGASSTSSEEAAFPAAADASDSNAAAVDSEDIP